MSNLYLFKRAIDGQWIFGNNDECEHNPGMCRVIPSTDKTKVSIIYFQKNEAIQNIYDKPITEFLDENGDAYADFAALKAGYAGFFFNVGGILTSTGLTFTDSVTGLKFRVIIRDSQLYFDKELTATGFAGTESTDGGATGDWMTIGGF